MFTIDSLYSILSYSGLDNLQTRLVSSLFKEIVDRYIRIQLKSLKVYTLDKAYEKAKENPTIKLRLNIYELKQDQLFTHRKWLKLVKNRNIYWYPMLRQDGNIIQYIPNDQRTQQMCIVAAKSIGLKVLRHIRKKHWTSELFHAAFKAHGCSNSLMVMDFSSMKKRNWITANYIIRMARVNV